MHESFYLLLHTLTAFMIQDKNDIYEITFMQQRDSTAFMFLECSIYPYLLPRCRSKSRLPAASTVHLLRKIIFLCHEVSALRQNYEHPTCCLESTWW